MFSEHFLFSRAKYTCTMFLECLLFALIVTLLIIIISVLVGADFDLKETMTRIRRTVGTYNTADEVQLPGVITSMPIMDYRHVWTDGVRTYSCDECPSKSMCPRCPKFALTSIESMDGGKESGNDSGNNSGNSGEDESQDQHNSALISLDAPVRVAASTQPEYRHDELVTFGTPVANALEPAYDLDPEFVSSRARMGAACGAPCNRTRVGIRGLEYDTASLGTRNDDIFDGDRKVVCSNNGPGKSSLKLLYTNVMGLENSVPFTASCEFLGAQGYLYKETCALGTVYP